MGCRKARELAEQRKAAQDAQERLEREKAERVRNEEEERVRQQAEAIIFGRIEAIAQEQRKGKESQTPSVGGTAGAGEVKAGSTGVDSSLDLDPFGAFLVLRPKPVLTANVSQRVVQATHCPDAVSAIVCTTGVRKGVAFLCCYGDNGATAALLAPTVILGLA